MLHPHVLLQRLGLKCRRLDTFCAPSNNVFVFKKNVILYNDTEIQFGQINECYVNI